MPHHDPPSSSGANRDDFCVRIDTRLYSPAVERHVKERLVGAAVLIAAAIILIPEMLSGPQRDARSAATNADVPDAAVPDEGAPLKTYTIDLSKSPTPQAAQGVIDDRAPPAETPAPAAEPPLASQTIPESTQAAVEAPVAQTSSEAGPPVATVPPADEPPIQTSRQPAPEVAPAPSPPVPSSGSAGSTAPVGAKTPESGWAVQLGSFASRVTAERMVKDLQSDGQDAFVMSVRSGQATLYRVRIGPMKDRESAAQTLRKVKAAAPGAAIVAHP